MSRNSWLFKIPLFWIIMGRDSRSFFKKNFFRRKFIPLEYHEVRFDLQNFFWAEFSSHNSWLFKIPLFWIIMGRDSMHFSKKCARRLPYALSIRRKLHVPDVLCGRNFCMGHNSWLFKIPLFWIIMGRDSRHYFIWTVINSRQVTSPNFAVEILYES